MPPRLLWLGVVVVAAKDWDKKVAVALLPDAMTEVRQRKLLSTAAEVACCQQKKVTYIVIVIVLSVWGQLNVYTWVGN